MVKAACLYQLRPEFLHIHIVQKAPNHQSHVYWWIKILRIVFKNGYPRNIYVKLFQNLTCVFREEDFLRISSCPYSAKSHTHTPPPPPPPRAAIFFDGPKFHEQILKWVSQWTILWNDLKTWQAVSEDKNFEEIFWSQNSEKSLSPRRPCFTTDQNFANNFWKGSHNE